MTTTIKLNDQEYSLEQLIRIHTEGAYQKLNPTLNLIKADEAQAVGTIGDYIAVAGNAGLRVLVKPTDTSKAKGVYILSKYLLKKAMVTTKYESAMQPQYRDRSYEPRRDSRPARPQGGYGDRQQYDDYSYSDRSSGYQNGRR